MAKSGKIGHSKKITSMGVMVQSHILETSVNYPFNGTKNKNMEMKNKPSNGQGHWIVNM